MNDMETAVNEHVEKKSGSIFLIPALMAAAGLLFFLVPVLSGHAEKAWLIYLTGFLLFTALSAGALLFSTIMHFTGARWSHKPAGIAEAFSAFFPVSFVLFLLLFTGYRYVFPWLGQDLHGKEVWLNVPFLFFRDGIGFLILYALGFGYIYHSLWFRLKNSDKNTRLKRMLAARFEKSAHDAEKMKNRMTLFAGWYMFAFAIVLSLVGFDLVMSMDYHWFSTLFGAYSFIKAIFAGLAALILVTAVLHLTPKVPFSIPSKAFRDLSTLFFGFSIVWGDFFYSQFVVIWYGNIPEETSYIIERTMTEPWSYLAWTVFLVCFIMPFLVLLSRKIKESPKCMAVVSVLVLTGLWVEHYLLLGPCYLHEPGTGFGAGIMEVVITAGFAGLFAAAVLVYFRQFPDVLENTSQEGAQWK